jgi:hypothetical protein
MARKSKTTHEVLSLVMKCSEHGIYTIALNDCYFTGGSQDCECCGSHGDVNVQFSCPGCASKLKDKEKYKANVDLMLNRW